MKVVFSCLLGANFSIIFMHSRGLPSSVFPPRGQGSLLCYWLCPIQIAAAGIECKAADELVCVGCWSQALELQPRVRSVLGSSGSITMTLGVLGFSDLTWPSYILCLFGLPL